MSLVVEDKVDRRDGIAFASTVPQTDYRARWEQEAAENHVRSAIADGSRASSERDLTAKVAPLWSRVPDGLHVGSMLDIGAGYGRIPLYLGRDRHLTCDTFCAVDISEAMLQKLVGYREQFDLFPGALVEPVCTSADELPIEDASIDLVVSSAVFLHMGKGFVEQAIREIARVLKPGGNFVFDSSFPNGLNPSNWPPRLKPRRWRNPNALKYWTHGEVSRLFERTGLAARAGGYRIEPTSYAILPKTVGPIGVPLARTANGALGEPRRLTNVLAVSFSAYSPGVFAA